MSSFEITSADSILLDVAFSLAFADVGPQERELRQQSAMRQATAPGLFTAIQDGNLIGAIYSQLHSNKTLLLWPPGTIAETKENEAGIRAALYRRIDLYAKETGADSIIAFVEDRPRKELADAGFEYVSDILTLIVDEIAFPMEAGESGLLFTVRPPDTAFEEMLPLFERTFEQTNDFPTLVNIAPAVEVLRSYQTNAGYRPDLWFFVQNGPESIGCLILTDHPEAGQLELTYLGLLPEHRGRKYAYPLVQQAQRTARLLGRRLVSVSVDSKNQAAIHVYTRCGFRPWGKKSLYIKAR